MERVAGPHHGAKFHHCVFRNVGLSFMGSIPTFASINVKFGKGSDCLLTRAKFHVYRCNVSPLWGEKSNN